jgi:Divergent InlB B-repeat domain
VRRLTLVVAVVASLWLAPGALAAGWCGTGITGQDLPDIVTGAQFHGIVALPADAPDRFGADANRLADDVATMTAWWQGQDPTRIPRFDTANFQGTVCLDLSFVRLPDPGASYSGGGAFDRVVNQLRGAGFDRSGKNFLVYYDGPSVQVNVCGTGRDDPGSSFAIMWLQGCADIGYNAVTAHELLHTLGALPAGAPHACPGDPGHPCDAPFVDILSPQTDGRPITQQVLDVGHDDYYAHSGSWLDMQDSIFLHRLDLPQVQLSVGFSGGGRVESEVPGVDCGTACVTQWDQGSQVSLLAEPADGQRFVKWAGSCTGLDCNLTLAQPASVTAVFGPVRIPVRISVAGKGAVKCSPACKKTFRAGDPLTLRAQPAKGWRFTGWTGGCRGTRPVCKPATDFALTVRAVFRKR